MKRRAFLGAGAASLIGIVGLLGCVATHPHSAQPPVRVKPGPPPHAPAHGYRHKNADGVDLVFDSGTGIYVVIDLPDHYFHQNRYYRLYQDRWQIATDVHGPWTAVSIEALPPGLRHPHGKAHPKKDKRPK